jgi:predicted ABC-type transport system involved in lysophospholipase L1 biosynthesis ATPase subunit
LKDSAPDRARQLLEKVGLTGRLGYRPGQLSGGERQRVAVVRALINRPRLLLADEPTGALDRGSAENLGDLLVRMNVDEGVSLIVVTHALDLAKRLQRLFELRDGALHELVDTH